MLSALLLGCRASEPAPTEIADLSRYLFRNWEDPEAMADGAAQLRVFLSERDFNASVYDRSYVLQPMQEADVAGVTHPGRDLSATTQVGVWRRSEHPLEQHAPYIVWEDQVSMQPTAEYYLRYFPETDDPSCFVDNSCDEVELYSTNDIRRSNVLYAVNYISEKPFQWVEGQGIFARAWFERSFPADDGETWLYQSFEIDVWMDAGDGSTWRYYAGWSESDVVSTDDEDVIIGAIRSAQEDHYQKEDEVAAEL